MLEHTRFSIDMKAVIDAGLENLDQWYNKTNDTNIYFVCLGEWNVQQ